MNYNLDLETQIEHFFKISPYLQNVNKGLKLSYLIMTMG